MTSSTLDRRRNAFRPDLAAESLRGKVEAERFAAGVRYQMIWPAVAMRPEPKAEVGFETEMVFGETITVFDVKDGWAWGQLDRDRYVGYVPADALSLNIVDSTHRVSAIGTGDTRERGQKHRRGHPPPDPTPHLRFHDLKKLSIPRREIQPERRWHWRTEPAVRPGGTRVRRIESASREAACRSSSPSRDGSCRARRARSRGARRRTSQ